MPNKNFNCIEELKTSVRAVLFLGSAGLLAASIYASSHSEITSGLFKGFSSVVTMLHGTTQFWRSATAGGAIALMVLVFIWRGCDALQQLKSESEMGSGSLAVVRQPGSSSL